MGEDDEKTYNIDRERYYRNELPAEQLLLNHMIRVAIFRDKELKKYASSLDTLVLLLPIKIKLESKKKRKELGIVPGDYDGMTPQKEILYDSLLDFIIQELESEDIIWKKAGFAKGHD